MKIVITIILTSLIIIKSYSQNSDNLIGEYSQNVVKSNMIVMSIDLTLNSDGTYVYFVKSQLEGEEAVETGKWSISNDNLIISNDKGHKEEYHIQNNQLCSILDPISGVNYCLEKE